MRMHGHTNATHVRNVRFRFLLTVGNCHPGMKLSSTGISLVQNAVFSLVDFFFFKSYSSNGSTHPSNNLPSLQGVYIIEGYS